MAIGDPHDREELIELMQEVSGMLPEQTRRILKLLTHPSVLPTAQKYFGAIDVSTTCTKYGAPWSCEDEEEALYETVWADWLEKGNPPGRELHLEKNWCEPCVRRVYGEKVVKEIFEQ